MKKCNCCSFRNDSDGDNFLTSDIEILKYQDVMSQNENNKEFVSEDTKVLEYEKNYFRKKNAQFLENIPKDFS